MIGLSSLVMKINIEQPRMLPGWLQSYAVGVEGERVFPPFFWWLLWFFF